MKILRSFIVPAVLFSSMASARPRAAFGVRSKAINTKSVTTLRGGALGMEREVAGKLFSAAYLTQGAAFTLAPKQQGDFYGVGDHGASTDFLMECLGNAILRTGVASYSMLYQGASVHEALGWAAVVTMFVHLKWLLNGTYKKVGLGLDKQLFTIVTNLVYLYAGFKSPDWAEKYFKAVIGTYALIALQGIFFTDASGDFWGDFPDDKQVTFNAKTFMYFLLDFQVFAYCLLQGVEPAKAIAYGSLVGLAYFLDSFFVSKEISEVCKKPTGYTFWILWFAFNIPAILLNEAVEPPPAE